MKSEQPHVSVITLNWNGWRDTIECLETVLKSDYENYNIILVDNHSDDESVDKIKDWALQDGNVDINTKFPELVFPLVSKPIKYFEIRVDEKVPIAHFIQRDLPEEIPVRSLILVHNWENAGFAAGNNLGIRIAETCFKGDYIFLLNNDTVIDQSAISNLVEYLSKHPEIGAATSAIYYYEKPEEIHNVGGKLTPWATSDYYTTMPQNNKRRITYVTGCALMVCKSVFEEVGLLSEKFFFGEEDFEFSWRLRKRNVLVICALNSKVYHKVSTSSDSLYKKESLRRKFIYVFARILDMKGHLSYPVWMIWRWMVMGYSFFWLTIKYRINVNDTLMFIRYISKYTRQFDNVKRPTVEKILHEIRL